MLPEPPSAPAGRPAPSRGPIRPTRRAALTVALVAVFAAAVPAPALVAILLAAVLAGAILFDWLRARRLRPTLERTHPPSLSLRVPIPFELHVGETGDAGSVHVRQPYPPVLQVDPPTATGNTLGAALTGIHRGTHEIPPAVVRTDGPLRLASVDYTIGGTDTVSVFPDLPRARRLAAARRRGRTTDEGRIRARLGLGTEFETIRDYSPDDDIRQVNWVATARVGRPMSNQYRIEENRDVMFMVDTGRLMASPAGELTRLDVALDAMAVLAVAAEEAGDRVGALAFEAKVTRQLAPRRRGAETIVRALFDLEPVQVESDYERAFYVVGRQKRALVVLFCDLFDEAAARTLTGALPVVLRHHAVLVVSCADPDLAEALSTPAGDVRGVMREAVALDLVRSHDRAARIIQSMGASVVEAPPESLGPACVQAYLRLKSRARI